MTILASRLRLTGPTTFYVRKDGSDNNDGSADDAAHAFLTIQAALDYVRDNVDACFQAVIVQVRAGTYNEALMLPNVLGSNGVGWIGGGQLVLRGDLATPSNVVIDSGAAVSVLALAVYNAWSVNGFKAISSVCWFEADSSARLHVDKMVLSGNPQTGIASIYDSFLYIGSDITIESTSIVNLLYTQANSMILFAPGNNIHFQNALVLSSYFAMAADNSMIQFAGIGGTGWGNVSGTRFLCQSHSGIDTGGLGLDYLPGTIPGILANGSWYN